MLPQGRSSASGGAAASLPPAAAVAVCLEDEDRVGGEADAEGGVRSSSVLRRWWTRYGMADWLTVIVIGLVTLFVDQQEPYHKPLTELQLQDPNISLPFKVSIVPNALLIFLAMVVPLLVFVVVFPFRRKQAGAAVELRLTLLAFVVCVLLNLLATDFGKKYIGRPRPNFISYTGYNATSEIYTLPHNLRDAFQSFPSGHASTSFAGLGFLSLWLYANLYRYWRLGGAGGGILAREDGAGTDDQTVYERRKRRSARLTGLHDNQLPLLLLLSGPLWLAAFIAFSRVRDNHHNYDDILAGSVLGSFIAVATFAALYTGRSHEWRSINEAAFRMQLQQEEDEENRAAGRDGGSGGRAPELHPLTGPEQPHPSRPHAHAPLGVPSLDLEAAIHKPGASPVPPHRQQQQQDSGARGEPISPSSSSSSAASGSDGRGPRAVAVGPPRFDSLRDVHGGDGGGITTAAGAEDASAGEVRLHQIV